MITQFISILKKPNFFIFILVFLTFALSILKTIHTSDIHHWEMILFSAKNVFKFIPFQERYEQYGLLFPVLLWPFNVFGDFSKFFTGLVFSLVFGTHLYLIYLVSRHFLSSFQSVLIALIFFLISPRFEYPWPDYLGALFLILFIYFLVVKKSKFSWIFLTFVFFIREVALVPGLVSLILVTFANYIFEHKLRFEIRQIANAIFFHLIIILAFLAFSGTYNEFFLQIFNFSFWQDTGQPIQDRFFSRYYGLLSGSSLSVKLLFFNLIFSSLLAFIYVILTIMKVMHFNKKFIILFTLPFVFSIMTIHIPDLYRFQIYTFLSLLFIIIILNKNKYTKPLAIAFLLLNVIIFSHNGLSNRYKDAATEHIQLGFTHKKNFHGYMFTYQQIQFYDDLENILTNINFVNKTPDPLIEIIFPQSKAHPGLPFYSEDFLKRINDQQNFSDHFNFYVTLINQSDIQSCKQIGNYPKGISFFEKTPIYLCKF